MKPLFRIFELTKSEQRVVLIVMLILITIAFIGYQRRVHRIHVRAPNVSEVKTSPSPVQIEDEQQRAVFASDLYVKSEDSPPFRLPKVKVETTEKQEMPSRRTNVLLGS